MGDDDEPELGPGVASHLKHQDAPIDKKSALNAVLAAIVQTGTSGRGPGTVPLDGGTPTMAPPPIQVHEFNSGFSPSVTYEYALGSDGKIYGKGDEGLIPPGPAKHLRIVLRHGTVGWTATVDVSQNRGPGHELITNTARSGAPSSVYDEADTQRINELKAEGEAGKADTQLEHRQNLFNPQDATTAVRQALVKLQIRNVLYDSSKEAPPAGTEATPATATSTTTTTTTTGRPPWLIPVVAVAAAVAAVVAGLVLFGGGGSKKSVATTQAPTEGAAVSVATSPTTPPSTAPKALPTACELLDPDTVGGIVGGRPMTEAPQSAGTGCKYTATDQPDIDVTTAYPPYISQVSVNFNAPQAGLTEAQVAQLFDSSKPAGAQDVPAGSARAYSSGGGSAVVLDRGVMIIVSTSGTMRPESIPDVQAMCVEIARQLRAKLS